MVEITLLKKRGKNETIIVTFHYAGVVLSLIPPGRVAPGVGWRRGWGRGGEATV